MASKPGYLLTDSHAPSRRSIFSNPRKAAHQLPELTHRWSVSPTIEEAQGRQEALSAGHSRLSMVVVVSVRGHYTADYYAITLLYPTIRVTAASLCLFRGGGCNIFQRKDEPIFDVGHNTKTRTRQKRIWGPLLSASSDRANPYPPIFRPFQ